MAAPKKIAPAVTDTQALSAEGVCAIIKACRQNGVATLRLGQLELTLAGNEALPIQPWPKQPSKVSAKGLEEIGRKALVNEEVVSKEDWLDLLKIEDPGAYERFVMSEDSEKREDDDE